jgi:PhnB protein
MAKAKVKVKAKSSAVKKSMAAPKSKVKKSAKPKSKPKKVSPIPRGFNTVSAYLVVPNSEEALKFYANALGAKSGLRMTGPDGHSTAHAEMTIGDSTVMLTDENPTWGAKSPASLGGSPSSLHLYVKDADKWFQRAVAAGCTVVMPIDDVFWGDRYGRVKDPYGHEWAFATRKENLSEKELRRRRDEYMAKMTQAYPPSDRPEQTDGG